MKTRQGFVSNSSSCSFTIPLDKLTPDQIERIKNHDESESFQVHMDEVRTYAYDASIDCWTIKERDGNLWVGTLMDNFDMYHFLSVELGIEKSIIEDDGFPVELYDED